MSGGAAISELMSLPAVILCGGLGTRLRSVIADCPKSLAKVAGRPFLSWLLDQLQSCGTEEAVLATGYKAERIRDMYGEQYGAIRLRYSCESAPLGTAGALLLATKQLPGAQLFLVMNGDSYCHMDLHALVRDHLRSGIQNSMVVTAVDDTRRFGSVQVDEDDLIRGFREKSATNQVNGAGLINAGVYIIARTLVESIPIGRSVSLENEIFPSCLDGRLRMWKAIGPFIDIGTPESFAQAGKVLTKDPGVKRSVGLEEGLIRDQAIEG